jgi:beta-lactamase superfamily II metal-dependent hydrolase
MAIRYLSQDTSPLYKEAAGTIKVTELLWGDQLAVIEEGVHDGRWKVRARGQTGYVDAAAIGDTSLLELYFIDVGQGDGVLIRTPDGRHIMIDGGNKRASQPSGKNAADFVDWKFVRDYGGKTIRLDAMIASHNDADHYGGLADLLDAAQTAELDADHVTVDAFYHAGVAWWKQEGGGRWLGETVTEREVTYLTRLMEDRPAVEAALEEGAARALQGEWANLMAKVAAARDRDGNPTPIARIGNRTGTDIGALPGFEPRKGKVAIRVLAPVQFEVDGRPALRSYGIGTSHVTNGNSVLLRADYGDVRILLTGDLNSYSQQALLEHYADVPKVFACDVAKACHHGSDDVSYRFLQAMQPAVTVISSGDSESYDHPRPSIVAASALAGHKQLDGDRLVTPLVYSTELARSLDLGRVLELRAETKAGDFTLQGAALRNARVTTGVTKAGALDPVTVTRSLDRAYIVAGLTYGLVNVRTDGKRILCATLNEGRNAWQVKVVKPRF